MIFKYLICYFTFVHAENQIYTSGAESVKLKDSSTVTWSLCEREFISPVGSEWNQKISIICADVPNKNREDHYTGSQIQPITDK